MSAEHAAGLISFIGILIQLGGACLLAMLFYLLHRQTRRRRYFIVWGWAWGALCVGIEALALRYFLFPPWASSDLEADQAVRLLYVVYQWSKLVFCGLLLAGALSYTGELRVRTRKLLAAVLPLTGLYAVLSVRQSADLSAVVLWQIPPAVAVFIACEVALLRLPPSRRSLGSKMTGLVFGMMAALWLLYLAGFGFAPRMGNGLARQGLALLLHHNSYVDLLLQMLLGYGMVVMLMEDAKRVVDDARARLEVAHDALRRRSFHDILTGALNRHAFAERVGLEGAGSTFGAVVMLDLDNLKQVNDAHGHAVGDVLLQHVARSLRASLRVTDGIYRWGGDEFVVVMPGSAAAEALRRIEQAVVQGGTLPAGALGAEMAAAVSTGAAGYRGAEDLEDAIRKADDEMYRRKHERKLAGATEPQASREALQGG